MTSEVRQKFPVGLTLTVAFAFAILVALGFWQLHRMNWKTDLLARVAALQSASAVPVVKALADGGDLEFRRVEIACPGLAKAAYVEMYGVRDGQAGVRLISACPLSAGPYRSLLVDRGFVADVISARPPTDPADTRPMRVVGILRSPDPRSLFAPPDDPAGRRFYTRDIPAMAAVLGVEAPAPVFLGAETATNPEWQALTPAPLPSDIPNNHLQYVITWFGLAAALVGVYAAMLSRRLKSR
jgi:surfeit locus 1 family protein